MLFCLGFGYSAAALARQWRAAGGDAAGTKRSARRDGARDFITFDGEATQELAAFVARATHILISIPPDERGDPVLDRLAPAIVGAPRLEWLGYLSTTGVYGDRGGAWVDETAALQPISGRSRRRVHVERSWLNLWRVHGVPAHIFRLPAIYGPGRSAIDQLRAGTARRIAKPGHVFSRIHVDDIAATLLASASRPRPGAIYNVADDLPAPAADVVAHAAALIGVAAPAVEAFESASLGPMAREFYAESRRVANLRIKRELGIVLRYPDFRAGLAAIAAAA
jgi:nucleoside-diphosphate-sugar epimerase